MSELEQEVWDTPQLELDENFNAKEVKGVGLAFVNLSKKDQELIDQYITGKGLSVHG